MTTLYNINALPGDYAQLAALYHEHKAKNYETISVSLQQWFKANMAAPLGAVLDLLGDNLNTVVFETIAEPIQTILQKNGFLSYFGYPQARDTHGTTIPYQKMRPDDGRYFREYASMPFFNRPELSFINVSLRRKMTEAMLELFNNAQIHSQTKHIYTCGQFFPLQATLEFCLVDTGIGFRQNFINRFGKRIKAVEAIRWAIRDRTTTKTGISGGIGLAILHEFIQLNQGKLQIISHDGFYQADSSGEQSETLAPSFPGTIVTISFRTDDNHNYSLSNEVNKTAIF